MCVCVCVCMCVCVSAREEERERVWTVFGGEEGDTLGDVRLFEVHLFQGLRFRVTRVLSAHTLLKIPKIINSFLGFHEIRVRWGFHENCIRVALSAMHIVKGCLAHTAREHSQTF